MPWAIDNRISQEEIEGGIDITDEEYVSAREAMLAGQEVVIVEGEMVLRDKAPSPDHTWEDGEWIAPPEPEPAPSVAVVSMRRARLAMLQAGILDDVTAAVEQAGAAAQIEWEYAVEVRRDHPLIVALAAQLEMSDENVDALFEAAAQIE